MDPTNDPERRSEPITVDIDGATNYTDLNHYDMVNSPPHYMTREMEAIEIIEMIIEIEPNPKVAYNMSNVIKYLLRFRDKGKAVHDLNKAVWYLNRMIEKIKDETK